MDMKSSIERKKFAKPDEVKHEENFEGSDLGSQKLTLKTGKKKKAVEEVEFQYIGMQKLVKESVEGMKKSVRIIEPIEAGDDDTNTLTKVRRRLPHESSIMMVNRGPTIPRADRVWVVARRGALFAWDLDFLEANKCRLEPGDEFILLPDQLTEYEGYNKEEAKEKMGAICEFLERGGWKCTIERGTYLDHTGEKEPPQCLLGD